MAPAKQGQASVEKSLGYLHLSHECGICDGVFKLHERCVCLPGNATSTGCSLVTRPFLHPGITWPRRRKIDGWSLCRKEKCKHRVASPEAATTHLDCFKLFTRTCNRSDSLDRLWRVAVWRKPWSRAPSTGLRQGSNISSKGLEQVANSYGLLGLLGLPPEIREIVRYYSQSSFFWRLVAALDLAAELDATEASDDFASLPIRRIKEWERGCVPVLSQSLDHLPIVRLTIDSRGIRNLERLPASEPRHPSKRFENVAFIVEPERCFEGVTVLCKDGQGRLELPEKHRGFHTWDTPNPPPLSLPDAPDSPGATATPQVCLYGPPDVPARFGTIDMSLISGLTFFYVFGVFHAIHAHTKSAPYAELPFEGTLEKTRELATWNFVPIPPNDRVLSIGLRQLPGSDPTRLNCILIRTKLSGRFSIGPWLGGPALIRMFPSPPSTMIYERSQTWKTSPLGAFSATAPPAPMEGKSSDFSNLSGPDRCNLSTAVPFETNFSAAPLANVILAKVFRKEKSCCTRGLLFHYRNGAQRALGQCRVGVDPYEVYEMPKTLYATPIITPGPPGVMELRNVRIHFTDEHPGDEGHDYGRWETPNYSHPDPEDPLPSDGFCGMRGTLHFWFNHEQCQIQVLPDSTEGT